MCPGGEELMNSCLCWKIETLIFLKVRLLLCEAINYSSNEKRVSAKKS